MSFAGLIRHPRLSRLLAVRWTGQMTDGVFQSALASFVLFSPERQANALSAAIGFAIVLLPYSIVGPFVGTILDRVSRQRALFFANLARSVNLLVVALFVFSGATGVALTAVVLIAFGINRLILAALSAGLPLLIDAKSLITANAIAVTGGSVLVVIGGGIGVGVRALVDGAALADHADSLLILMAAGGYFTAALLSGRLGKYEIGPQEHEKAAASFKQGFTDMREGIDFLRKNIDTGRGIIATAVHRGGLTALTLTALLLERNTFNDPSRPEDGLQGFVRGYELQASVPFDIIHEALDGFGIVASATFMDGKLNDGGRVPGLSEEIYTLTAYYEYKGFEFRISGTKRDEFQTEERGLSLSLTPVNRKGSELWDAQIGYDFSESGIDALDGSTRRFVPLADSPTTVAITARNGKQM